MYKPSGSWSLCWFVINPWSDVSVTVNTWKSYMGTNNVTDINLQTAKHCLHLMTMYHLNNPKNSNAFQEAYTSQYSKLKNLQNRHLQLEIRNLSSKKNLCWQWSTIILEGWHTISRLPLEIMHSRHDYLWPWVSLTHDYYIICS